MQALATFHFILMDIVTEKDEKRRLGLRYLVLPSPPPHYPLQIKTNISPKLYTHTTLRMMGMSVTAFWAAWCIVCVVLSVLSAGLLVLAGQLAQCQRHGDGVAARSHGCKRCDQPRQRQ